MDNASETMKLLLIEDEAGERAKFLECAKTRSHEVKFVGSTNSSDLGYEIVLNKQPDGVILDLELHRGVGSGKSFLQELEKSELKWKPIIVVTTNTHSDVVYTSIRNKGVDYIYYKKQHGYSHVAVIDDLLDFYRERKGNKVDDMAEGVNDVSEEAVDDIAEEGSLDSLAVEIDSNIVSGMISSELDSIGMGHHLRGRAYLEKAIVLLVIQGPNFSEILLNSVADSFSVSYSSITRAMQTAIDNAWYDCDPEVLKERYTIYISPKKGKPSANELIHFYANKIRKNLGL